MTNKSHVRPGYPTVTAGLNVSSPEDYIVWAQRALGAEPAMRVEGPDGRVMHAEIRLGDTIVAVDRSVRDPETKFALFHVYVPDVDAAHARAVAAGAVSKMPPTDMFWGERVAAVADSLDNRWAFATFKEAVPVEEMKRRAAEYVAQQQKTS